MKNPRLHALFKLRDDPITIHRIADEHIMSRSHLNDTVNGRRPVYDGPADQKPATQKISTTWKKLKRILTPDEFKCAFDFANEERKKLGYPLLVDDPTIKSPLEKGSPAKI